MTIKRLIQVTPSDDERRELATFELRAGVVVSDWKNPEHHLREYLEQGIATAKGIVPFSDAGKWFDALELAFAQSTYVAIIRDP